MSRWPIRSIGLVLSVLVAASCTAAGRARHVPPAASDPPWFSGAVRPDAKDVVPPYASRAVPPVYPPSAVASQASGDVWLDVRVEEDGSVSHTRIVTSSPPFDGATETAVKRWHFTPAEQGGNPVAAIIRLQISFVSGAHDVESDTEPEWFKGAVRPPEGGVPPPKVIKTVGPANEAWCISRIVRPPGDVWLDVRVEANGKVSQTRIVPTLSVAGRAALAHAAARQWEFVPVFLDGRPVPSIVRIKLSFANEECVTDF